MKSLIVINILVILLGCSSAGKRDETDVTRVIAFYTAKNDLAHISFVREANVWFSRMAPLYAMTYDSTSDWTNLNTAFLANYDVVLFLDTRPEDSVQREEFRQYMEVGGGWVGFHFAGFALNNSGYPQDWDWYHEEFLGSGEYKGNTWRPTGATLRIEHPEHPVTKDIGLTVLAAPNEWYSWKNDIRKNADIEILLSIDPSSFPLGTGPKEHEIWHKGYYPVVWTNRNYRMVYFNMGHNDMDYEGGTNATLSYSFSSEAQNRLVLNAVKWAGRK